MHDPIEERRGAVGSVRRSPAMLASGPRIQAEGTIGRRSNDRSKQLLTGHPRDAGAGSRATGHSEDKVINFSTPVVATGMIQRQPFETNGKVSGPAPAGTLIQRVMVRIMLTSASRHIGACQFENTEYRATPATSVPQLHVEWSSNPSPRRQWSVEYVGHPKLRPPFIAACAAAMAIHELVGMQSITEYVCNAVHRAAQAERRRITSICLDISRSAR